MRYRWLSLLLTSALALSASAADTRTPNPLAGIGTSVLFGDKNQSRETIEEVLTHAREQKDGRLEALSLLMLGINDLALHDSRAARESLREATVMRR